MICVGYHQMTCGLFNLGRSVICQQEWRRPDGSQAAAAELRRAGSFRHRDPAQRRVRVRAIKQRGVSHGPRALAPAFAGDPHAKGGPFIAVNPQKPQLHELVGLQQALQFFEKSGGQTSLAEFQRGFQMLSESAKVRSLTAGESWFVHGGEGECAQGTLGWPMTKSTADGTLPSTT